MRRSLLLLCLALPVLHGGCRWIAGYDEASAFDVLGAFDAGADIEGGLDAAFLDGSRGDARQDAGTVDGAAGDAPGDSLQPTRHFLATLRTAGAAPIVRALAVTADGEVGLTGFLLEGTTLSALGGDLTSAGQTDFFVLRLDADGVPRWVKKIGGGGFDRADDIAAIGADALLLSGYFQQEVDFGRGLVAADNASEAFALKIDATGSTEWVYTTGGSGISVGSSVVAHETGEATLFGHFSGSLEPMPSWGAFSSAGESDLFVVGLDNKGDAQWAKAFGGTGGEIAGRARLAAGGLLVLSGQFEAEVDFGGGPRVADNGDGFVLALQASGAYTWDYSFGDPDRDSVRSLLPLLDGRLVVKPLSAGMVDFGGGVVDCGDGAGPLVWLDQMGRYQSSVAVPGSFDSFAAVSDDELVVIGHFSTPMDFGGGQRIPTGTDTMLVYLDLQGGYLRDTVIGGAGAQQVTAAAFDREGALVVVGLFTESISLASGLSATDPQGLFIARVE